MMTQLDQNMKQTGNQDYVDGKEGRIKGHSGKESLKGAPSKQGFMIGEQEEDPGTQRDDPSAYTNDEVVNGVEGVKLVGKASRTERQSIRGTERPG